MVNFDGINHETYSKTWVVSGCITWQDLDPITHI